MPIILFLCLIGVLFLFNGLWVVRNGYDLYGIELEIAIFGVANIVFLAVSARSKASAVAAQNDRPSTEPNGSERFFSLSLDLLCVLSFDGYLTPINPAAEKMLGYAPRKMIGKLFLEFVHPDDRETTLKEAEVLLRGIIPLGLKTAGAVETGLTSG